MLRCTRCCKAGDSQEDIQSQCVDKQTIGCPDPIAVIPGKDIVMTCRLEMCGRTFSFPAAMVVNHRVPTEVACIGGSPCGIVVMAPVKNPEDFAHIVNSDAAAQDKRTQQKPGRGKAKG